MQCKSLNFSPSQPQRAPWSGVVCTNPSLVCTNLSSVCTRPSLVCTSPSLVCTNLSLVCTSPSLVCTNPSLVCTSLVRTHFFHQTFLGPRCVRTTFSPVDDDDESADLSSWGEPLGVYRQSFHSLMTHSLQRRPHTHWGHQKVHRAFAQLRHSMIQNLVLDSYFLVLGCVNWCTYRAATKELRSASNFKFSINVVILPELVWSYRAEVNALNPPVKSYDQFKLYDKFFFSGIRLNI